VKNDTKIATPWFPIIVIGSVLLYFLGLYTMYPTARGDTLAKWSYFAWNTENDFIHGRFIPIAFIAFVVIAWKHMKKEPQSSSIFGLLICGFGILLYLGSIRAIQPRIALIGLPFIITGGVAYAFGWRVTKHMLFPAFFWYFAIPLPGIQQATNFLQVFVTDSCYLVGRTVGIDLVNTGDEIRHATKDWDVEIAAGCSGIKSLMSLVMISAIYSYYTQRIFWKRLVLFLCAFPLAVMGNFFRVFTIILLCDFGYEDAATGVYHDYAGLLIFFPIALFGLFVVDTLILNRKKRKLRITRTKGIDDE